MRNKMYSKPNFSSYLLILLMFIIFFLTFGCARHANMVTGTVKEIHGDTRVSPLQVPETVRAGGAIVGVENVTIPTLNEPPPPLDYIVGPNDSIFITVNNAPEFSSAYSSAGSATNGVQQRGTRVDGNGNIQIMTLGLVKVGGMTLPQIREHIQNLLKRYLKDPSVVVEMAEYKSSPLYLLGQFKNTGVFYMDRPYNVLQGLALGGGYTEIASPKAARIIRDKRVLPVDVYELLMSADQTQNVWLRPGDTIFMPDSKSHPVLVFGVGKAGVTIPVPPSGLNILQAVAICGLEEKGYHSERAFLIRSLSPTKGQLMVIDIDAIIKGDALPLQLCEGDVIYLPKSSLTSWNEALNEMLPTFQAFGAILTPFIQLKYLFD
jgi:polysaccharide biosynthesis/export protein